MYLLELIAPLIEMATHIAMTVMVGIGIAQQIETEIRTAINY